MHALARDLRRAARMLRDDPLVAMGSALSLALGIGAVTVILSTGDALFLQPLPGTGTAELVRVSGAGDGQPLVLSHPEVEALREAPGLFSVLVAERTNTAAMVVDGAPRTVGAAAVSEGYFAALEVPMTLGGGFGRGAGGAPVVVVSHGLWESAWGRTPDVLGRTLRAGGVDFTVVGVAGPGFHGAFPGFRVSAWFPLSALETVFPRDGDPTRMEDRFLDAVGVPVAGLGPEDADTRAARVADGLRSDPDFGERRTFRVAPARGVHPRLAVPASLLLAALALVAAAVMAAACANAANLLLARGIRRRGDYATRRMLGAGTIHVARPVLVESAVLALSATVLGLAAAAWGARGISAFRPPLAVPLGLELEIRPTVALAAGAVGLLCAAVSGLLPVLSAVRVDPGARSRPATRGASATAAWGRRILVTAQVAVTCVLLTAAALLVTSLGGMDALDVGFDRRAVATVEADPSSAARSDAAGYRAAVARRLGTVPGVTAVAGGQFVHLGDRADRMEVAPGREAPGIWPLGAVHYSVVDGSLLPLLGIRLEAGRSFGPELGPPDPDEVVVNRALAARLWPDEDALGATLRIRAPDDRIRTAVVVGVAETVKYRTPDEPPTPFVYLPSGQWPEAEQVLHVRLRGGDPGPEVLERLRRAVRAVDPAVPVVVRRMDAHRRVGTAVAAILRSVLLGAGVAALLMAGVGILAVVGYATRARTRELAIRMAVGGSAARIQGMVVREALATVLVATVLGLVGAAGVARILSGFLYGVSPLDPLVYAGTGLGVAGAAVTAAWVPARTVTRELALTPLLRDG